MKKLLLVILLFSVFFLSGKTVFADCLTIDNTCRSTSGLFPSPTPGQNPRLIQCQTGSAVSGQITDYCCTTQDECTALVNSQPTPSPIPTIPQGPPTCDNGAADNYIFCSTDRSQSFICHVGQNPQYQQYQNCSSQGPCENGTGCTGPVATPTLAPRCGQEFPPGVMPNCPSECPAQSHTTSGATGGQTVYSCGPVTAPTSRPSGGTGDIGDGSSPTVDSWFLHRVNPLTITGDNLLGQLFGARNEARFATPGAVLNRLLRIIIFPAAGMILFVMILWGGFEMLSGANDTKSMEAGKQRITAALIGFILLFCAYWIAQIVGVIFGVTIVG
jgi:hypothetical protein